MLAKNIHLLFHKNGKWRR